VAYGENTPIIKVTKAPEAKNNYTDLFSSLELLDALLEHLGSSLFTLRHG